MPRVAPSKVWNNPGIKASIVAVFAALSLATNYALIALPNIKLMDALVFIAAFLFGIRVGVGVATMTWLVYGFINPYGQADFVLLSFLIVGECFYALAGGVLSRAFAIGHNLKEAQIPSRPGSLFSYWRMPLVFSLVGFQATFAYDVLTNFGSWIFKTNSLYQALVIGIITGVPFAVLHEVSNIIFFGTVAPVVIVTARRFGFGANEKKA